MRISFLYDYGIPELCDNKSSISLNLKDFTSAFGEGNYKLNSDLIKGSSNWIVFLFSS